MRIEGAGGRERMELVVINSTNITAMTSFANNANECVCRCVCFHTIGGSLSELSHKCSLYSIQYLWHYKRFRITHNSFTFPPKNPYTQTHMPTKRVKASANDHICCGSQNSKLLILKSN